MVGKVSPGLDYLLTKTLAAEPLGFSSPDDLKRRPEHEQRYRGLRAQRVAKPLDVPDTRKR